VTIGPLALGLASDAGAACAAAGADGFAAFFTGSGFGVLIAAAVGVARDEDSDQDNPTADNATTRPTPIHRAGP
jgi:hypothetical protein